MSSPSECMQSQRMILLFTFLLFAFAFVSALFPLSNFDIWWHLRTGSWILEHSRIPQHDFYSLTAMDNPWISHEWMAEVFFYFIHKYFAINGLIALRIFFLLALTALALALARNRHQAPDESATALFTTFAILMWCSHLYVRPHLFSLLGIMILLFWWDCLRPGSRPSRALPPLLMIPWANLHSGFILGLGIYALLLVGEALQCLINHRPVGSGSIRRELRTFLITCLTPLVNPHAYKVYTYPFRLISEPVFTRHISELESPFHPNYQGSYLFAALIGGAIIGGVLHLFLLKRREIRYLPLFIIGLVAGLVSIRNVPIFASVFLPGVFRACAILPRCTLCLRKRAQFVVAALILGLTARVLVFGMPIGAAGARRPGISLQRGHYPIEAVEFLETQSVPGELFHNLRFGGYLLFNTDRAVFIDGRLMVYGPEFLTHYISVYREGGDYESWFSQFGINACLLTNPTTDITDRFLQVRLGRDPAWALVYWDDTALLFVRRRPELEEWIGQNEYEVVNPIQFQRSRHDSSLFKHPEAMIAELKRAASVRENRMAVRLLAYSYERLGEFDLSVAEYQRMLEAEPRSPLPYLAFARIARRRRPDDRSYILSMLKKAERRSGEDTSILMDVGVGFQVVEELDHAERVYQRVLHLEPENHWGMYNLGLIAAQREEYDRARYWWDRVIALDPQNQRALESLERLEKLVKES